MTKTQESFIGFWTSEEMNFYLSLYSMQEKKSKSKLLNHLLDDWYKEMIEIHPKSEMLKKVGLIFQKKWNDKKTTLKNPSFKGEILETSFCAFAYEVKASLIGKLSEEDINVIIEGLSK